MDSTQIDRLKNGAACELLWICAKVVMDWRLVIRDHNGNSPGSFSTRNW
jgi:hypothetical protein